MTDTPDDTNRDELLEQTYTVRLDMREVTLIETVCKEFIRTSDDPDTPDVQKVQEALAALQSNIPDDPNKPQEMVTVDVEMNGWNFLILYGVVKTLAQFSGDYESAVERTLKTVKSEMPDGLRTATEEIETNYEELRDR